MAEQPEPSFEQKQAVLIGLSTDIYPDFCFLGSPETYRVRRQRVRTEIQQGNEQAPAFYYYTEGKEAPAFNGFIAFSLAERCVLVGPRPLNVCELIRHQLRPVPHTKSQLAAAMTIARERWPGKAIPLKKAEDNERGAIIHPCPTHAGNWRLTLFDRIGFWGHSIHSTLEKAMQEGLSGGFIPSEQDLLEEFSQDPAFHHGVERSIATGWCNYLYSLGLIEAGREVIDVFERSGLSVACRWAREKIGKLKTA